MKIILLLFALSVATLGQQIIQPKDLPKMPCGAILGTFNGYAYARPLLCPEESLPLGHRPIERVSVEPEPPTQNNLLDKIIIII